MTRADAIAACKLLIEQGDALRYLSDADGVWLETEQGWDPAPAWTPFDSFMPHLHGANDTNPD